MNLLLLSTGGTIAMAREEGALLHSHVQGELPFLEALTVGTDVSLAVEEFERRPSSNFDSVFAQQLAARLTECLKLCDGVIVTHGTDTLEETSFYTEMVLQSDKPVVFTGAMRTASEAAYDRIANIQDAIKVASTFSSAGKGVLVVCARDIVSAVHVVKQDSERANAFGSSQTGKFGSLIGDQVVYYYESQNHPKLENKIKGKVGLVKVHYDIEPDFLEHALSSSDALIIECLGSGRIPPKLTALIKEHSANCLVILSSRIFSGHLYDCLEYEGSYQSLRAEAVIFSPLNSLKSCILAKLCLGNEKGFSETRDIFHNFWSN